MDQIRANTPAPIKANLMTEQLSVQMSRGNGGCTRAGSPGDQQSRELGPWATRRSRAMMRANAWGHDELRSPKELLLQISQIAKFMGPKWGPPRTCRPKMGPMLAPWTLLSGIWPRQDYGMDE